MLAKKFNRGLMLTVMMLTMCFGMGCTEDCEEEHTACLAKIKTTVSKFSYEVTCRYPSMNSGDARRYCECEDEYQECKSQ